MILAPLEVTIFIHHILLSEYDSHHIMQIMVKEMNKIRTLFIYFIVILTIIGCSNESVLIIKGNAKLLKNPYPDNYPSTNPQHNDIISMLKDGDEGEVLESFYGKDYKAYKVKMKDGKTGYLINGDNFKILKRK